MNSNLDNRRSMNSRISSSSSSFACVQHFLASWTRLLVPFFVLLLAHLPQASRAMTIPPYFAYQLADTDQVLHNPDYDTPRYFYEDQKDSQDDLVWLPSSPDLSASAESLTDTFGLSSAEDVEEDEQGAEDLIWMPDGAAVTPSAAVAGQTKTSRNKRDPLPNLSTWVFRRRSNRNPEALAAASTASASEDEATSPHQSGGSNRLQELNNMIMKLKVWEAALLHRFGDRFRDSPESLALNPIWVKVMKLRSMLHQLMQMAAKAKAGNHLQGLDTTRM